MANNAGSDASACGFSRRLCGAKACNQAGERNRVGGGERNNALPQRAPCQSVAHGRPIPIVTNSLAAKKFPRQRENARAKAGFDAQFSFPPRL